MANKTKKRLIISFSLVLFLSILVFSFYILAPGQFLELRAGYYKYKADVEEDFIDVDNYKWSYFKNKNKKDKETIVFVHGFTGSKMFWLEFLAFFKDYNVIVPDLPGHGNNSYFQEDNYSIRENTKRLNSFVDKLGLKNFYLVGISLGGAISGYYASLYPDKVKKLVLIDAAGAKADRMSPYFQFILTTGENLLIFKDRSGFNKMMSFLFVKPPKTPSHIIDYYLKQKDKMNPRYERIFNDLINEINTEGNPLKEDNLKNIVCPTLIIWGKEDKIIDISAGYNLNKSIKNSKLIIVENVGHVPPIEAKEFTSSKIREFFAEL